MAEPLRSITEEFTCVPGCRMCFGTGHVCEDHPWRAWGGITNDERACGCGAAGMPCGARRGEDGSRVFIDGSIVDTNAPDIFEVKT